MADPDGLVFVDDSPLLGRTAECARIEMMLRTAANGRSESLVLLGEAGVGKSMLLRFAEQRAAAAGIPVLRCRGLESESQLSFSGLGDLLRPVEQLIAGLPVGQAAELFGALALGPPAGGNRFAVYVGTLAVLGKVNARGPLLVVVDDLHWLDRPSAEAIVFAARRLDAEGVVVVMAVRAQPAVDGGGVDLSGLSTLVLAGLPIDLGMELVRRSAASGVSDAVARLVATRAAGNPLALVEITRRLSADQLTGRRPLHEVPSGPSVAHGIRQTLAALPAATRLGLLMVAAADTGDPGTLHEALAELGLDPMCLDSAEAARLVTVDAADVAFRHPLIRSVVTEDASGADRRRVHAGLAVVAARRGQPEREAWYRAVSLTGPDETVADALARTAAQARDRAGPAAAARALERAAEITGDPERRATYLLAAAREATAGGTYAWSRDLLGRVHPTTAAQQAELVVLRATVEQACGSAEDAHAQLRTLGERVGRVDADRGGVLLAGAALAAIQSGRIDVAASAAAATVELTMSSGSTAALLCAATRAVVAGYAGDPVPEPNPAVRILAAEVLPRLPRWPSILPFALSLAMVRGAEEEARRVISGLVEGARTASELGRLPIFLTQLSELHLRDGRWYEAYAEALEARSLATEIGQHSSVTYAASVLARLEACRGEEQDCLGHLEEAGEMAIRTADGLVRYPREAARGLLHLTLGRPELAVRVFERLLREQDDAGLREPAVFGWLPDLIEAQVKTGRPDDARESLRLFRTDTAPSEWALAVMARCRGLLAGEADYEREFCISLERHGSSLPFERARTELCFGERLRRSRRRSAALGRLDSALDTFTRIGARPWADRARAEILVAGGEGRPVGPVSAHRLTPQELQVALLVGRGSSNREVAAALFLSEKTIEAHLTRIYRALGVRSRSQLGATLRDIALA